MSEFGAAPDGFHLGLATVFILVDGPPIEDVFLAGNDQPLLKALSKGRGTLWRGKSKLLLPVWCGDALVGAAVFVLIDDVRRIGLRNRWNRLRQLAGLWLDKGPGALVQERSVVVDGGIDDKRAVSDRAALDRDIGMCGQPGDDDDRHGGQR